MLVSALAFQSPWPHTSVPCSFDPALYYPRLSSPLSRCPPALSSQYIGPISCRPSSNHRFSGHSLSPFPRQVSRSIRTGISMQLNGAVTPARGDFLTKYTSIFVLLPLLSNVFPYLITMAESAAGQDERRNLIILFLILKRVYLYCMAISIVDLSALRSIDLPSSLGSRLKMLNDEILQSFGATNISKSFNEGEVAQQAYAELDNVSGVSVAVFLPAFLVLSLFSSFFLFGSSLSTAETSSSILPNEVLQTLRSSLNLFPALVEVRNFFSWLANGKEDNENGQEISTSNQIPLLLSTAGVLFAFLTPSSLAWPIRNVINTCIAVTAARSVQLASLPVTVAALGGLVLCPPCSDSEGLTCVQVAYDLFGVYGSSFLVPPAAAVGPASSVMESVGELRKC
eukprot:753238-Hanusia_phi.AAC.1